MSVKQHFWSFAFILLNNSIVVDNNAKQIQSLLLKLKEKLKIYKSFNRDVVNQPLAMMNQHYLKKHKKQKKHQKFQMLKKKLNQYQMRKNQYQNQFQKKSLLILIFQLFLEFQLLNQPLKLWNLLLQ